MALGIVLNVVQTILKTFLIRHYLKTITEKFVKIGQYIFFNKLQIDIHQIIRN